MEPHTEMRESRVKYLLMLLCISLSSGCVSIATFYATHTACMRNNVRCSSTETDKDEAAIDAAIEDAAYASQVDRGIYNNIKDRLTAEADSDSLNHFATDEEMCEAGLIRICTAVQGCFCEPTNKTDPQ